VGRFRLQCGLWTAVVVMLVAGGMLGINMRRYHPPIHYHAVRGPFLICVDSFATGWPFPAYGFRTKPDWVEKFMRWRGQVPAGDEVEWHWFGLSGDVLVALAIIIPAGVLCEWLVRRRGASLRNRTP